jgi:hypothetical protein
MNQMTEPATAIIGDRIEHELMPGFVMAVEESEPCETDCARPGLHRQYLITDPEGNRDWLCAYDVTKVG